jgi:superfamily I DNA/RNA helicase
MNSTWWAKPDDLDQAQRTFIQLPPQGRYILDGPPGSGKTNLLLLRAQFVAGSGEKNVLIVTYTNTLADFIRSGIALKNLISSSQIRTFHSWAVEHVRQYLGWTAVPLKKKQEFDDNARQKLLEAVQQANKKAPSKKLYSAIFVDEAQDLSIEELEGLLCLSDNVCICGDVRQGLYDQDGMSAAKRLGLKKHPLTTHYRIGQRIARAADRLMPPKDGTPTLEDTCNYDPKVQGKSSADMHECGNREEQFENMVNLIRVQLDAFKDDMIGIFCGRKETLGELRKRFDATDLSSKVCVHGVDQNTSFEAPYRIHVLTIHSAKGTEFRAVHLYGAEELHHFPMNRREIGFTAITRARTALNAFRTGATNKPLENAFAQPSHMDLDDLFPKQS